MNPEYFIVPLIMAQVSHIITALKSGYIIIDCLLFGLLYLLYKHVNGRDIRRRLFSLASYTNNKQTVVLIATENKRSVKFRSIMYYLSKRNNTIYKVREVSDITWDDEGYMPVEKSSEYLVDQSKEFALTDKIYGLITTNSKEKSRGLAGTEYIEYNTLKIYSHFLTLVELQDWINITVKEYKQYLKKASNESQLYITASTSTSGGKRRTDGDKGGSRSRSSEIIIEAVSWESTIMFENSYFHEMDEVIKKIDFFLNNKEWYLKKGIPYNLGILLHGEPGCGKTRFIKQLMNYTGRHGIDIKLNDAMNFNDLYNIIFKEEISEEYIIPQNQRILIFEDIDAMGEAVKCRDMKAKDIETKNKKEEGFVKLDSATILSELLKQSGTAEGLSSNLPNKSIMSLTNIGNSGASFSNLSYLLNMLDGINECSGRIIIMTSNKPEVLDKALIRPGRIDIKINFQKCTTYDVMRLINLFWDLTLTEEMLRSDINMKYTSAEIYNIFRSTNDFENIKEEFVRL